MKGESMGTAFETIKELVNRQAHILEPFRQYLSEYFEFVADEKGINEQPIFKRPLIGLKLDVNGGRPTLAVRPGWKKAKKYPTDENPGIPGEFQPQEITLELVKELKLILSPGEAIKVLGRVYVNQDTNKRNLKAICETADSLLRNPLATFGQQADRCVCCHRSLTDLISRTRGIGPECIKWFSFFDKDNHITRKYRAEYRDLFAPFEISADVLG
jgi:hypothetical protein